LSKSRDPHEGSAATPVRNFHLLGSLTISEAIGLNFISAVQGGIEMTTLVQIELATERAILTRLVLELLRNVQRHYFPETEFFEAVELTLVGVYVFLAQQDRRPCNVTHLSRRTGLSRATVRRRLANLIDLGYVEVRSRRYLMGPRFATPPGGRRTVQTHIAAVNSAARKLANLAANQT
jgi:DNA-binding transcriptional ArsR family regulator